MVEEGKYSNQKISEALQLLEEAAKEKKDDVRKLVAGKYDSVKSLFVTGEEQVSEALRKARTYASKQATYGEEKVKEYSKVLDEDEQMDFELATGVEGIDDEIALLRVKIKSLLKHDPENMKLIMQATNALARLVRTRYNISKDDRKGLKEAIGNVLRDVALPLGIGLGTVMGRK